MKGCYYFCRDILITVVLYSLAAKIDGFVDFISTSLSSVPLAPSAQHALIIVTRWVAWCFYFHWQGLAFAGLWCLGHEAGHATLSTYSWLNTFFGFTLHTVSKDFDQGRGITLSDSDTEYKVSLDPLFLMAFDASRPPRESSLF